MYGYYTPIFLFQAFCIYHAYRNNAEQRWYWLILFFPLIGCIIYFIHSFNNRDTIESLKENVKHAVNSNYKIEQLEKALRFSENLQNKLNLANAYVEFDRHQDAIPLYSDCLQGFMSEDPFMRMKLMYAHFMSGDYNTAVECGNALESEKAFKGSEERVAYAWALFHSGNRDKAEKVFSDMDKSFTNYYHRLEYCKFLLQLDQPTVAKDKFNILLEEYEQMQATERRLKKNIFREVRDLYAHHFQGA